MGFGKNKEKVGLSCAFILINNHLAFILGLNQIYWKPFWIQLTIHSLSNFDDIDSTSCYPFKHQIENFHSFLKFLYKCIWQSLWELTHGSQYFQIPPLSLFIYIYIYIYIHHHHIVLAARISLTLSRHSSLSFIALGRSSGQQPVSSHSCWMYVRAGRPVFARPCVGIHKSTSLMSSSLLLQQCPAYLVRLTWIVFVIGGRWPYCWCLVGCCCQDLFRIARSILV